MSRRAMSALLAGLAVFMPVVAGARGEDVAVAVHADKTANAINPFIYGHFFEHIYNGGDNGIWGEMVWNRSFEYIADDLGHWEVKDGVITETEQAQGARMFFGDPAWKDYEFTLQARKLRGAEGFLVLVRGNEGPNNTGDWNWVNIAGWNNTGHQLQHVGDPGAADLGTRLRGTVETNRWYTIRVRCEGTHVQAWLDTTKIVDTNLTGEMAAAGNVGIGTWNTAAEFKDFKVTDLAGKVLYQAVPALPGAVAGAGHHWDTVGDATVELTDKEAANDEHAVHIAGGTVESGLAQDNFCLKVGENYKGSLFLKGKATGGKLRFVDGASAVNEIALPAVSAAWKEYPISFTASRNAPDATMQIVFPAGSDVTVDHVSLMSEAALKNDGFRPDIYQAFAALKPTIIRWPGGCYAEQYHWKNGIGPQAARTKNLQSMWNDYDPNALGTDEYLTLSRKLGSEPLLVINTGMHVTGTKNAAEWMPWIQEACDWVEYCNGAATTRWGAERAKNGHPLPYKVKYWEIDNELWRSLQTSPAVYAQAVPLFAAAMKKVDPTITIIAHGGNATDRNYDRVLLNNAAANFDILSIHHYTDAAKFDTGVTDQDNLYRDLVAMIKASKNPDIQLDVSEWNAQTTDWRTGLYAGGILNTFEKYGANLQIGGPALLFRHTSANDWDNAFINFDHKGYFVAPNYVIMKLWRDHFAPTRLTTEGATGKLNLIASKSDAGQVILKAVNPSNTAINVTATIDGGFAAGAATFELVAPGALSARNTMAKPDTVKPVAAEAKVAGAVVTFTMPAYSAGVVSVAKK